MSLKQKILLTLIIAVAAGWFWPSAAPRYDIVEIHVPGVTLQTEGADINDSGHVVGQFDRVSDRPDRLYQAGIFKFVDGRFVELDLPPRPDGIKHLYEKWPHKSAQPVKWKLWALCEA